MSESPRLRGQLCIWTGVDPAHELDFNRWYDREHMQERVAIAGFQSARRFRAVDPAATRPYLALYDTDDLAVFTSAPYRQAFTQQTEWSLRNFARMTATQRRVGELAIELGDGEGGALALMVVPPDRLDAELLRGRMAEAARADHVIRVALLRTDPALSTPLTAGARPAAADGLLSIEATSAAAAEAGARELGAGLGLEAGAVTVFRMLWRIGRRPAPNSGGTP